MAAVGGDLVRSAEWRQVCAFAETIRTAPAALAVQGEAGAGKSTLWRAGIQTAVRFAREHGLRVAAQGTGHNARPLGSLEDTILVKTERMRRVIVDPAARIARAEAGAVWLDVVEAAAENGLAALAGSSPDVGVVGYTIGGGISWLGRAYGLAANNVEAIELVTADGRLVRADACTEPDLFWAQRGGGGSFGVVTAIELRLFPITEVYAGQLWWPTDTASQVLQAWRELTHCDPPEEFTSAAGLIRFPAAPDVPGHLRGGSFAIITVIHLGAPAEADALLAPLRALGPVTDTVQTIPVAELLRLHIDPDHPVPSVADWLMLASLPAEAIEEFADTRPDVAEDLTRDKPPDLQRRNPGATPQRQGSRLLLTGGGHASARLAVAVEDGGAQ